MPGMSTVSTGSPRPTRCHGSCGGSGAFGAFGALFFLDFDFLRSLDIVLSRSYRAVPELSCGPGVIVRSPRASLPAMHCTTACSQLPAGARAAAAMEQLFLRDRWSPETYRRLQRYMNRASAADAACLLVSYRPLAHDSCWPALQSIAAITHAQQPSGTASIAPAPRALRRTPPRQLCTAALHALLPGALVVRCSGDRFRAADGVFEQ